MRSIWPRRQFRNDKLEEEKKERRGERKENGSWEGERARLTDTSGRTRLRWEVWEGGGKGGGDGGRQEVNRVKKNAERKAGKGIVIIFITN